LALEYVPIPEPFGHVARAIGLLIAREIAALATAAQPPDCVDDRDIYFYVGPHEQCVFDGDRTGPFLDHRAERRRKVHPAVQARSFGCEDLRDERVVVRVGTNECDQLVTPAIPGALYDAVGVEQHRVEWLRSRVQAAGFQLPWKPNGTRWSR